MTDCEQGPMLSVGNGDGWVQFTPDPEMTAALDNADWQTVDLDEPAYHAKGAWLMSPDGVYLQLYRVPADAARAATDMNTHGRAEHPLEYERRRRKGKR